MNEPVNFFAQQEANRRRTRWLVVAFILFFVVSQGVQALNWSEIDR